MENYFENTRNLFLKSNFLFKDSSRDLGDREKIVHYSFLVSNEKNIDTL